MATVSDRLSPAKIVVLQKNSHRSEHWTVVATEYVVTRDDEEVPLGEKQSGYSPFRCIHRLENRAKIPLSIVEDETGTCLEKENIVRFENAYDRV